MGTFIGMAPSPFVELEVSGHTVKVTNPDKVFFPALRAYLTEDEEGAMLAEFREFDRRMIHEKYRAVAHGLAAR